MKTLTELNEEHDRCVATITGWKNRLSKLEAMMAPILEKLRPIQEEYRQLKARYEKEERKKLLIEADIHKVKGSEHYRIYNKKAPRKTVITAESLMEMMNSLPLDQRLALMKKMLCSDK